MVPASPTATQSLGVAQLTALRDWEFPDERLVQVRPPSVLTSTFPPSPTATQSLASGQLTPLRFCPVGWALATQAWPSSVRRIAPTSPTATQCVSSAHEIALKSFPCGPGFPQIDEPSAARALPAVPGVTPRPALKRLPV